MKKISKRYLICNGDANSYSTHRGLPYNLFKTAKKGIIEAIDNDSPIAAKKEVRRKIRS